VSSFAPQGGGVPLLLAMDDATCLASVTPRDDQPSRPEEYRPLDYRPLPAMHHPGSTSPCGSPSWPSWPTVPGRIGAQSVPVGGSACGDRPRSPTSLRPWRWPFGFRNPVTNAAA